VRLQNSSQAVSHPSNAGLRAELLAMAAEDSHAREELLRAGRLPRDSYSPVMREIHERNNRRFREIVAAHGWPGRRLVGEDGCEAAWLIIQHAVLEPEFQTACVPLLEAAVAADDAPAWQLAYLSDRVLVAGGRPQVYGTQYRMTETGKSVPFEIADAGGVDERRRAVGLCSLEENTRRIHAEDEQLGKG
jgi:hypothetical protein